MLERARAVGPPVKVRAGRQLLMLLMVVVVYQAQAVAVLQWTRAEATLAQVPVGRRLLPLSVVTMLAPAWDVVVLARDRGMAVQERALAAGRPSKCARGGSRCCC